jgi:hypothetical protein
MLKNRNIGTASAPDKSGPERNFGITYPEMACVTALFLMALALRLKCLPHYQVIAADGTSYVAIARDILRSHSVRSAVHYPPFYPFLIALASLVTSDFEAAGVAVSLVMGSLVVVPVYLLGRGFFTRGVGVLAALFAVVWPEFVSLSTVVLAQATYITLLTTGTYLLWLALRTQRSRAAVASSVFFACAYLTRQEAFISLAGICFCVVAVTWYHERSLRGLRPLLVACLCFAALIFPYMTVVHDVLGVWTLAGKSMVTLTDTLSAYLNRPDLNRDPSFVKIGYLDLIATYPGYFPYTIHKNLLELSGLFPVTMVVFAVVGFVAARATDAGGVNRAIIAGSMAPIIALVCLFFASSAYIAPYVPFLFLLCSHGFAATEAAIIAGAGRVAPLGAFARIRVPLVTTLLVAGYALSTASHMVPSSPPPPYDPAMDGGRYDQKQLGLIVKRHLPPGSPIMTRSGRVGFYSGLPRVDMPQADLPTILATARAGKVRYLVIEGQLVDMRPQLGILLMPLVTGSDRIMAAYEEGKNEMMPGIFLKLLYKDPASQGVVVYELR